MLIRNTKPSRFLFRIRSRHVPTGISKFGPNPRFWTQLSHPQWALAHLAEATLHRCEVHSRPPHRPGAAGIDRGTRISTGNHPQWPRKALRGPGAVFSRPAAQNSKTTFFSGILHGSLGNMTPTSDPRSIAGRNFNFRRVFQFALHFA